MQPRPLTIGGQDWLVLIDPGWRGDTPQSTPPAEVMVGGWTVNPDRKLGLFEPNPRYRPLHSSTPTDPIDALARLTAAGEDHRADIIRVLRDTVVQIGCDQDNEPVVVSPDTGVPCVLVVTAEIHKQQATIPRWWPIVGNTLADIIPDGVDVLFNAGSANQLRFTKNTLSQGC